MKVDVLGVNIDNLTKTETIFQIENSIRTNQKIFIVTPYSESIVAAQKDNMFKNIINSADLAIPDGIGILWAAHFLKYKILLANAKFKTLHLVVKFFLSLASIILAPKSIRDPIKEKISGSEFVWDLAKLANRDNLSMFLLGGYDDTAEKAAAALTSKLPGLKIVGTLSPSHLGREHDHSIIEKINIQRPDILLVAFGPVRQEKWIFQNLTDLKTSLVIGLGGTFDHLAGKRAYRPDFWARIGLEWLWRLFTQPWRVLRIARGIFGLVYYSLKAKV